MSSTSPTSGRSPFRRPWVLLAGVLLGLTGGWSQAAGPEPAGGEAVVIPDDWRAVYPFSARFPDVAAKSAHTPIVDLAAVRFATGALAVDDGRGGRELRMPDLGSFPAELIRRPFAKSASDLFVVQAASPKHQVTLRAELDGLGVDVLGYVPRYAYLVRLLPAQARTLSSRPQVFWLGLFQPAWRIAPKLDFVVEAAPGLELQLTALFERQSFSGAGAAARALARAGFTVLDATLRERDWKVRLKSPAAGARRLAAMPGCLWVERFAGYRLHNDVARSSADVPTGRGGAAGPLMDVEDVWARGLRGEGQIAAVSDTGLSTGDFATLHQDFGVEKSATNPLRVIKAYPLGRPTWDDNQTLGGGHGTHVAGSLAGNGARSGADPSIDDYPPGSYAGTAPKAQLVFQSLLDAGGGLGGIPGDLNDLFQPPYDDGARVHSNSWGTPLFGAYTSDSQEVDEFVWNHPDMVISYTAGNQSRDVGPTDGVIDADAIGAPGTAKNNITVGASENHRPDFIFEAPAGDCTSSDGIEQKTWGWFSPSKFSMAPIFADLMADDASGLAAFSSRGPTNDGRVKPDLVAPGIAVISTRTDKFQTYQQWGTCQVPPALRPHYLTLGGTSMANPLTAGAAVLVRQYYEDGWHAEGSRLTREVPEPGDGFGPTAALVKATLLNGAWDMRPGQYGGGPARELPPAWDAGATLPDNAQGYGRVDLESALFPGSGWGHHPDRMLEVHDATAGLATGGSHVYSIPVASNAGPLTVTLVWTDPYAALGAGAKLVNDLDLSVASPAPVTLYDPNGVDVTAGGADHTNNVEQTRVTSPVAGNWTITVSGWNVPGNGEPGTTVQPYALAISGVLAPPCATPAAPGGLAATPVSSNRIDLTWNPTASDSYSVYRASSPGGPYARVASGLAAASFSDTGVSGGTTYYYVVAAVNDPGCESPHSSEVSAEAFGDCALAPSFLGLASVVTTDAGGSCGLRLSWPAATSSCPGGPPVYNVYRSTSEDFTPGPANLLASCVTDAFYDDTSALSGTEYYYVVRAEDAGLGGGGPCRDGNADAGAIDLAGTAGGDGTVLVFADDFDGNQAPGDLWYFGLPSENPYSGDPAGCFLGSCGTCVYTSDWWRPETGFCSGNSLASNDGAADPSYSIAGNGRVALGQPPSAGPPFSDGGLLLPAAATSITLTFDHDYEFESSSDDWDGGRLLLSDQDWPNFTAVAPVGGYPGTIINSTFFCPPWPNEPAYVDDSLGCVPAEFDLSAYAGRRIWLAWNHGADNDPETDDGWAIDNVRVEATVPGSCTVAPPAVLFLTATARDGENEVEWLNPTGAGYATTMVRYRTDTFPADPADGTQLVLRSAPGAHDATTHTGLTDGITYYYSAFVRNGTGESSARKTVSARPFDTSGDVKWAYSAGASALTPPAIGSVYGVANDRAMHSMATGPTGGTWPTGWTPMAMNAPAQARPPVVPITLGAATKVAFLGSQDGRVYAADANAGQQLWMSPDLGGLVQAAPAGMFTAFGGAHDLIFAGTRNAGGDSAFYGLKLADGTVAWTFDNGGGAGGLGVISSSAAVDYGSRRVYFASRRKPGGSQHTAWCLTFDGTSAAPLWSRDVGDVDGSPILHGGRIYVGTNSGSVHALDAATGSDLWAAPFDAADGPVKGYLWPRFGTSELVFSTGTTVWSIRDDGAAASLVWSEASIPGPSTPLVGFATPHAWVGGSDGKLYQLDLSGPSPAVSSVTLGAGGAAVGSPALDLSSGIAYVGSDAGRLFAVAVPLSGTRRPGPPPEPAALPRLRAAAGDGPACEAVRVGSPQAVFGDGFESGDLSAWESGTPTFSSFSATGIMDLDFEVRFPEPPPGDQLLRLEIFTPSGHLYQELTRPFTAVASRGGGQRSVDGFPRPLPVTAMDRSAGGAGGTVRVRFPVAGTTIVHSALYGTWTVAAYVGDSPAPCGPPTDFRLEN